MRNPFIRTAIAVLMFFFLSHQSSYAVIVESAVNGYWEAGSTWNESTVPTVSDDAVIGHTVTISAGTVAELNSLTITQSGNLIIYGTLIVNGSLLMDNNGSELTAAVGAAVIIMGDAHLGNKVNLDLSSFFIVKGDFIRDGASNQGSISVSGAHIYVFGSFQSSWDNFTVCDESYYDGTTSNVADNCDAGRAEDFIEHTLPEDLPDGIYDQLVGCSEIPTATLSGNTTLCDDGSTAELTVVLTGSSPWTISLLRDDGNAVEFLNINTDSYSIQVSDPGIYSLASVHDSLCTGTVSGTATVIVNPLPPTSDINTN